MRTLLAILTAGLLFTAVGTPAVAGPPPVDVVHSEVTQVGPYQLRTSFSEWPLRSERSLDFLFDPELGIKAVTGKVKPIAPSGKVLQPQTQSTRDGTGFARHPRALDSWGFDIVALTEPGTWRFEYTLDGPRGAGRGVLEILVGSRPGPPSELAWSVGLLPLAALVPMGSYLWWRTRRRRDLSLNAWS
ncbi:hypothetical protein HPO96_21770 [Kribbella sandramycini]|uniref:Uncharacterized protein n=1 Tax=Kribbella sandramycini TaxID=60450 RepID=A0A7Y4L232_9ACTN|nr:hypothetical protein [Kribbella sandramycini]MBB6566464.1 hypothetical protein [Kribbella sandramycini]NOL42878.1 hypothetical protein [Kribbella sandramycini]